MDDFTGPVVLSVTSRFENIEVIAMVSDSVCRTFGFDGERTYAVNLALREGVANAMKHGNRWEVGRLVEVRIGRDGDLLRVEVEDQGEGFDPAGVPDPLAPENRMKTSGRGILYMRNFMDRQYYRFDPGRGTVLVMEKKI